MMVRFFYFVLLVFALVVAGISLAFFRSLHHSILLLLLFIPIWFSLLVILASLARFKYARVPSGNGRGFPPATG